MTLEFMPQRKIILGAIMAIFIIYVLFQSRNFLMGPQVKITSPLPNSTVDGPIIEIQGTARNVAFIALNDRQIFVDDSGRFKESLIPPPGLVILKLVGRDRFGRVMEIKENLVVRENSTGKLIESKAPVNNI